MGTQVVTFALQAGAGGEEIARAVAKSLGYRYYDREVILQAASLAEVSPETVASAERWPGFVERMVDMLGRASLLTDLTTAGPVMVEPASMTMSSADYRGLIEQVVEQLADAGRCVIVGHAGQVLLQDKGAEVFKVLVHGSPEKRAERLAMQAKISHDEALERVHDADKQRVDFFKHVYDVDWLDSELYDLVLNTDNLDPDQATATIVAGAGSAA